MPIVEPWPYWTQPGYPQREALCAAHTIQITPNFQEQMGVDPISKLASAIERLADALEREGTRD